MADDLRQRCTGSDNPANRCGLHHCTELAMMGGYSCCCGAYWTSKGVCQSGAKRGDEVSLRERISELVWYAACQVGSPHDLDPHVDALLAVQDAELETLRQACKVQRDQIRAYVRAHQKDAARWSQDLEDARASIARVRDLHKPFTLPGYTGEFCDECADGHGSASRWPCSTLAALDSPVELIELTHEEWETARDNDLTKLGCTLAELEEMARTGDYATPGHRALWLAIKPVPRDPA